MRAAGIFATVFLLACRFHALTSVPIHGGTAEQRAAVQSALVAFDSDIGVDRLALYSVRFGGVDSCCWGRYSNGRVFLAPNISVDAIPLVARHELCHALDDAEGWLSDERGDLLDRLAEGPLAAY